MALESIPDEITYSIEKVRSHLRNKKLKQIKEDASLDFNVDIGWRPSFSGKNNGVTHTFDLRSDFKLEPSAFTEYILSCINNKLDVAIWLIVAGPNDTPEGEPSGSITLRKKARIHGLGLCYVTPNTNIEILENAVPTSLIHKFSPDQIKAGQLSAETKEAHDLFQRGDWLPAMTRLTQTFELAIVRLGHRVISKNLSTLPKATFDRANLHQKIEYLGGEPISRNQIANPPLDQAMLRSCLSYKDARNLANHPANTQAEKRILFDQAVERMITGFRIIRELDTIKKSIR